MPSNNHREYKFTSFDRIQVPAWGKVLVRFLLALFLMLFIFLALVPWRQTSQGTGRVIALNPSERVQNINATVSGRVKKWFVRDGSTVKEGDPIVEVVDNDPMFTQRLKTERDAAIAKFIAAKIASETSFKNYERQENLFKQGLTSKTKVEKAKISYKKLLSSKASADAKLAQAEVEYSRQQTQLIKAPSDGTILRVLHGSGSVMVNTGDLLAVHVPSRFTPAAEVYIDGNDLPLIYEGRRVRLQFEGWPAVQISGWPSLAIGTFEGQVSVVDQTTSKNGKFRILVTPHSRKDWPGASYLRQGARVYSWILLDRVRVGQEVWRKFNGLPPNLEEIPDEFIEMKKRKKKKKKKKKKKDESEY